MEDSGTEGYNSQDEKRTGSSKKRRYKNIVKTLRVIPYLRDG